MKQYGDAACVVVAMKKTVVLIGYLTSYNKNSVLWGALRVHTYIIFCGTLILILKQFKERLHWREFVAITTN